jgi:TRAP-type uncharacterized transport system fused permease subunit
LLFYLLMVARLSPTYSGLLTVLVTVAINQVSKETRLGPKGIYFLFVNGTKMCAELTALIAVIGVVQQAFTITGLGHRLSEIIVNAAGGNPVLILVLAMVIAIVLGMGLPTPIAYLLSGIFVAPALVRIGFSELASHFFLFYFAIKSGSTPPIAVVAVVAAGIARANWLRTAWQSFVFSLPGFFIAFAFVLNPGYLMEGRWSEIFGALVFGVVGVAGVSCAMQRYLLTRLTLPEILLLSFGSIMTVLGRQIVFPIVGVLCIFVILFVQVQRFSKATTLKTSE